MDPRRRWAARLALVAALILALLGQVYFFHRRAYLWDGLVLHGLAALCFGLAWRWSLPARPRRPASLAAWLEEQPIPAALLAVGLGLSFTATMLNRGRTWQQATGDVVLLWSLGLLAAGLAAWLGGGSAVGQVSNLPNAWRRWRDGLRHLPRRTRIEAGIVVALTLLAASLRFAALGSVPYTVGGDEAWHGLLARQVLHGELRNPFVMGYMSMPTAFYWPLSWALRLAGDSVVGLRIPAALVGSLTVPFLYLFARSLWGRRTALLAALFLAAWDYPIHYSRLGANNIWDPLFVLLALWALDRGLTARRWAGAYFLAVGLVMGLGMLFYTGTRLLPVLIVLYVGFVRLRRRRRMERLGLHLALLLVAFLIAAGPMLSYALAHPNEWNARINQVGILQSGWLRQKMELSGESVPFILAEQFLRAAGAFHVFPDRTVWYGADRPLLGFGAGLFALLGMAWAAIRWHDRRYFLVLIWFWSVIIIGGMLTESPPSSQRLVIATPAVALLVAFGLVQTVRLAGRLTPGGRGWERGALALLILLLAVGNVRYYFAEYTPARRYGGANGETATMIGRYLQGLTAGERVYLLGAPRLYWNFGTMRFLAPQVQGQDVAEPLQGPPDFVDRGRGVVFIVLPHRRDELTWVQQALPGGELREFYDLHGQLRFIAYRWQPPGDSPSASPGVRPSPRSYPNSCSATGAGAIPISVASRSSSRSSGEPGGTPRRQRER